MGAAEQGNTYEALDPFTGHVATRAAAATTADVDRAVSAAQDAFAGWAALPPGKRRHYMLGAADAVEARAAELLEAITTEMGGPAAWGGYNVKVLAEKLRFAAGTAYQGLDRRGYPLRQPVAHDDGGSQACRRRRQAPQYPISE